MYMGETVSRPTGEVALL